MKTADESGNMSESLNSPNDILTEVHPKQKNALAEKSLFLKHFSLFH